MNAIAMSYYRSIQRGKRTLEDVPASLRERVAALLEGQQ